jgi:hypothetical protein
MKLHGTITANLEDAIASAQRLRGHPVYTDTIGYWQELVRETRRIRMDRAESERAQLDALIVRLETEILARDRR